MFGRKKKAEKQLKQVYSFEYRVIEKKDSSGKSYFIGESTKDGGITMLTSGIGPTPRVSGCLCPRGTFNCMCQYRTPSRTIYSLVSVIGESASFRYTGLDHNYAQFSDPCKVKEHICRIRKEQRDKESNLNYTKVVSEGSCCV